MNESKRAADNALYDGLDEYVDRLISAGYSPNEVCSMLMSEVAAFCDGFLSG
jgi:hypothetical protein